MSNGEDMFCFSLVTAAFEHEADKVYEALHIQELSLSNVWNVFRAMLPLLFP